MSSALESDAWTRPLQGRRECMEIEPGTDSPYGLRQEIRDSAALIVMALAVVVIISVLGLTFA
jgi:hypothetical protein